MTCVSALSATVKRPRLQTVPAAWLAATPLRRALAVTVSWRIVIGLWGIIAHGLVPKGPYGSATLMHRGWSSNPFTLFIDAGVRMDGFWYAGIAQHGYGYTAGKLASIAFFPLYPAAIKLVSFGTGNVYVGGMLIATVSLFLAVWALQAWLDHRGMGASSALAAGLMLCFPVGFFWASMYTESLFLALALATFVFFERDRWLLSAACAALAVLCRPTGLILAPCLAMMAVRRAGGFSFLASCFSFVGTERRPWGSRFWNAAGQATWLRGSGSSGPTHRNQKRETRNQKLQTLLPVIAGPVAYAGFAAYQWVAFGSPLATVRADQAPPFSRNLSEALSDLMLRRPGFPSWYLAVLLGLGLIFLAAVPLVYRRFGLPYALFAALAVLFPMSTGLVSLERYVMIDFPVFAAVALTKTRAVPVALMTLGFYISLGLMALFVNGYTII